MHAKSRLWSAVYIFLHPLTLKRLSCTKTITLSDVILHEHTLDNPLSKSHRSMISELDIIPQLAGSLTTYIQPQHSLPYEGTRGFLSYHHIFPRFVSLWESPGSFYSPWTGTRVKHTSQRTRCCRGKCIHTSEAVSRMSSVHSSTRWTLLEPRAMTCMVLVGTEISYNTDFTRRCRVFGKLEDIFRSMGLKTARQPYIYSSSGRSHTGENVYSILHAPRGDATEAIVLVAAWRNMDGKLNRSGVALLFTLAKYFKRMKSLEKYECSLSLVTKVLQGGHCGQRTSSSWSPPTAELVHKHGWMHIIIHTLINLSRP